MFFNLNLKNWWKILSKNMCSRKWKFIFISLNFKRNFFFHAHILLINYSKNDVIAINIDVVVQIVISNSIAKLKFYKLMTKYMIHKNCKNKIDVIYHDKNDNCIKRFSKSMLNVTNFFYLFDSSQYRRSNKERISNTI